jgi:hypothetical protein
MSYKKNEFLQIEDNSDSDDSNNSNIDWNEYEIEEEKISSKIKKINVNDEDSQDEMESSNEIQDKNNPEVNIQVISNKNGEKSVQISLLMKLEKKNDIVNINFNINKATFLNLAKDLE